MVDGSARVEDGTAESAALCVIIDMVASSSIVDKVLPAELNVISGIAEAREVRKGVLDERGVFLTPMSTHRLYARLASSANPGHSGDQL